jgi:hypothetical protein
MSFRFYSEPTPNTTGVSYVHHPNLALSKVENPKPEIKLVEPEEVKATKMSTFITVTGATATPAPVKSNTVINHPPEPVPVGLLGIEHNVAPTLGLQIARTPSPAPIPVENQGVTLMRIKRRETKKC